MRLIVFPLILVASTQRDRDESNAKYIGLSREGSSFNKNKKKNCYVKCRKRETANVNRFSL